MEISKIFLIRRHLYTCKVLQKVEINNIKNKKPSSQRWLVRQLQDPYVEKARQEHYRCRSAFKLLEINKRFNILSPGLTVVDCGAAPGSWSQVAAKLTNSIGADIDQSKGRVIAIDKLPIYPIDGVTVVGNSDFTSSKTQDFVKNLLSEHQADVILSDMAPNASGVRTIDHDQIINLAYSAMKFAIEMSKLNGVFITKLWDGGKSLEFEKAVEKFYKSVRIVRPKATRDESSEKFVLAQGFRGLKNV